MAGRQTQSNEYYQLLRDLAEAVESMLDEKGYTATKEREGRLNYMLVLANGERRRVSVVVSGQQ